MLPEAESRYCCAPLSPIERNPEAEESMRHSVVAFQFDLAAEFLKTTIARRPIVSPRTSPRPQWETLPRARAGCRPKRRCNRPYSRAQSPLIAKVKHL